MVVPLVFVVVLLMEGLTRPGCNSWRDKGSSLSTGPGGWMQIVNFIACGLLILVPAAALARSHPSTTMVTGQRYPMNFRPCRRRS